MDFGQTLDSSKLASIEWKLPATESSEETSQLERLQKAAARSSVAAAVYVGTPIWSHAPWVGTLYPPETPAALFLHEYSKQFKTVEVNSTFYGIPPAETFLKWKNSVGEDFRFCPKFPKSISHSLNGDHPDLKVFAERIAVLGDRLGVCFLQFPPHVGPDQRIRLQALFAKIPRSLKTVVEFRNPAFFQNQRMRREWVDILAQNFLGTVCIDTPLERELVHTSLSSTRIMIRFLGANLHESNAVRFDQWAERIALWMEHGIKEVYFVVHEPDNTFAPETAKVFIECFKS
jgi:uncharacterized protein YecE (DUF72 family)